MYKQEIIKFYDITNKEGLLTKDDKLVDNILSLPYDEQLKYGELFATEYKGTLMYFTAKGPISDESTILVYNEEEDMFSVIKANELQKKYKFVGTLLKKLLDIDDIINM